MKRYLDLKILLFVKSLEMYPRIIGTALGRMTLGNKKTKHQKIIRTMLSFNSVNNSTEDPFHNKQQSKIIK